MTCKINKIYLFDKKMEELIDIQFAFLIYEVNLKYNYVEKNYAL